jgi:sensor histidine kinase YesM
MEKRITEAKLMTLQAQIEPHFLFNTLSNILNLFDTDIERGKSMQQDLIHYLESSLSRIRTDLYFCIYSIRHFLLNSIIS